MEIKKNGLTICVLLILMIPATMGTFFVRDIYMTSPNLIYGEMSYHNYTPTDLVFVADSTHYSFFMDTSDTNNGLNFTGGFGVPSYLTSDVEGTFLINYYSTGSGINNHEYHVVIFINEEEKEHCETMYKLSATGDVVTMTGSCIEQVSVGDNISLRIADYTSASTGKYYAANLNLVRIGS